MSDGEKRPGLVARVRGWGDSVKAATILGLCVVWASVILSFSQHSPGRYQLGAHPGHVYVIDTFTGQVWERFNPEGSGENDSNWKKPK